MLELDFFVRLYALRTWISAFDGLTIPKPNKETGISVSKNLSNFLLVVVTAYRYLLMVLSLKQNVYQTHQIEILFHIHYQIQFMIVTARTVFSIYNDFM